MVYTANSQRKPEAFFESTAAKNLGAVVMCLHRIYRAKSMCTALADGLFISRLKRLKKYSRIILIIGTLEEQALVDICPKGFVKQAMFRCFSYRFKVRFGAVYYVR